MGFNFVFIDVVLCLEVIYRLDLVIQNYGFEINFYLGN